LVVEVVEVAQQVQVPHLDNLVDLEVLAFKMPLADQEHWVKDMPEALEAVVVQLGAQVVVAVAAVLEATVQALPVEPEE
jgi:hypothetical protein